MCLILSQAVSGRLTRKSSASCVYKGGAICHGAVVSIIGRALVKICDDGVIKYKTRELVGEDYPLVGRDTGAGKGKAVFKKLSSRI